MSVVTARPLRDRFCSYCGTAYLEPLVYPRRCPSASCAQEVWANPIPVCVALVPARRGGVRGLLVLRRGIEPRRGMLALPGGFLEAHETWQQGCARELREELDITVDPTSLTSYGFVSTSPRPDRVLLFACAPELDLDAVAPFTPNHETLERGMIVGPDALDAVFAFPLHTEAARRWFVERSITGAHGYVAV